MVRKKPELSIEIVLEGRVLLVESRGGVQVSQEELPGETVLLVLRKVIEDAIANLAADAEISEKLAAVKKPVKKRGRRV